MYKVSFLNAKKVSVTKTFDSLYKARLFVNKLKRSKTCVLISYPLFN